MKINRVSAAILPLALAGLLLAGGCKKQDQQASNEAQPAASTPVPATSPSTGTPAAPPATSTPGPAPSESAAAPAGAPATAPAPATPPPPPPPPPPIVIPAGTH